MTINGNLNKLTATLILNIFNPLINTLNIALTSLQNNTSVQIITQGIANELEAISSSTTSAFNTYILLNNTSNSTTQVSNNIGFLDTSGSINFPIWIQRVCNITSINDAVVPNINYVNCIPYLDYNYNNFMIGNNSGITNQNIPYTTNNQPGYLTVVSESTWQQYTPIQVIQILSITLASANTIVTAYTNILENAN